VENTGAQSQAVELELATLDSSGNPDRIGGEAVGSDHEREAREADRLKMFTLPRQNPQHGSRIEIGRVGRFRLSIPRSPLPAWPRWKGGPRGLHGARRADHIVRTLGGSQLGIHRYSLRRLATILAEEGLALEGRRPLTLLSGQALAAEVVDRNPPAYFAPVAHTPGFPASLFDTLLGCA